MFKFVNLLLDKNFLLTDYITYTSKLLFWGLIGAIAFIILLCIYYVSKNTILKVISQGCLIILTLAVMLDIIVAVTGVLSWLCLLYASVLKSLLITYLSNELIINIISIFISFYMILFIFRAIFKKALDNIDAEEVE